MFVAVLTSSRRALDIVLYSAFRALATVRFRPARPVDADRNASMRCWLVRERPSGSTRRRSRRGCGFCVPTQLPGMCMAQGSSASPARRRRRRCISTNAPADGAIRRAPSPRRTSSSRRSVGWTITISTSNCVCRPHVFWGSCSARVVGGAFDACLRQGGAESPVRDARGIGDGGMAGWPCQPGSAAGGSQGPVVKRRSRTSRVFRPHLVAVER